MLKKKALQKLRFGKGKPLREFLFVEDLADVVVHCLKNIEAKNIYDLNVLHLNCGSNDEVSIQDLALFIKSVVEYSGDLSFDPSKPDGTLRRKWITPECLILVLPPKLH